jgi:hypothetical protein
MMSVHWHAADQISVVDRRVTLTAHLLCTVLCAPRHGACGALPRILASRPRINHSQIQNKQVPQLPLATK